MTLDRDRTGSRAKVTAKRNRNNMSRLSGSSVAETRGCTTALIRSNIRARQVTHRQDAGGIGSAVQEVPRLARPGALRSDRTVWETEAGSPVGLRSARSVGSNEFSKGGAGSGVGEQGAPSFPVTAGQIEVACGARILDRAGLPIWQSTGDRSFEVPQDADGLSRRCIHGHDEA